MLLIMKLCLVFLLVFIGSLPASVVAQQEKVSLDLKDVSVKTFLSEVKKQTNLHFVFSSEQISRLGNISVQATDENLESVLKRVFSATDYTYELNNDLIIIRPKSQVENILQKQEQSEIITGKVTDKKGYPLPGVTIRVKGIALGTSTNRDGVYKLIYTKQTEPITLVFSFIGMKTLEVPYKGTETVDVVMEEDLTQLDEVVVSTGYQKINARENVSSISSIKGEDILVSGLQTIDQMLEGHVAGLTYMANSGQVGAAPRIRLRGTTTVLGSQEPLWVLDGVPIKDPVDLDPETLNDLDFVNLMGNAISGINPEDIEQIDILKDASATALYGKAAAGGVIVITTKSGKVAPPSIRYSVNTSLTRRPHYTDRAINVMNSKERIALSREIIEKRQSYSKIENWVGYEDAYRKYINGLIDYPTYQQLVNRYETINTDWFDILMQDSFSHNHTISLSGGTQAIRYNTSLGFSDTRGTVSGERVKRYTTNLKLEGTFDRFSIQFTLNANTQKRYYLPSDISVSDFAYNTSRAIPAYNEDGSYWYYYKEKEIDGKTYFYPINIMEEMKNSSREAKQNGMTFQTNLGYRILPELTGNLLLSYSFSNSIEEVWHSPETYYCKSLNKSLTSNTESAFYNDTLLPDGGELKESRTMKDYYTIRAQLDFRKVLDQQEEHIINVNIGGEINSTTSNSYNKTTRGYWKERGRTVSGFDLSLYKDFSTWMRSKDALGYYTDKLENEVSAYFIAGYGFNSTYFFNFNMRFDFSNEFGDRAREKFFPIWSVGARWNLDKNVLAGVDWVNGLSLRATFGYQGNVPKVSSKLIIEKQGTANLFDENYSIVSKFRNPDLKWEKTASVNVGVDFSLFNRKISGTVEYYHRKTIDAYVSKSISEINGVSGYVINGGTITNQGYDLTLRFIPVNNRRANGKGFQWRFDPQLGQVINKLIDKVIGSTDASIRDDNDITYSDFLNGTVQTVNRSINGFYSYRFMGLSPEDGRPMFPNLERYITVDGVEVDYGEQFKLMTNEERYMSVMEYSGTRVPTLQGGLNNTFSYDRFTLSINMAYSLGSKVRLLKLYPAVSSDNGTLAPSPMENVRSEMNRRWRTPGDENHTNIPGILSSEAFSGSDGTMKTGPWWKKTTYNTSVDRKYIAENIWQMYDYSNVRVISGDYLKIQNISLRYNIPDALCNKLRLKSASVSLSGTNLYTFSHKKLKGQDPTTQTGSSKSIPTSVRPNYSFSMNVSF